MQASQWTTEIIVISAVLALASLVIGYFIATLRQGRQIGTLTAQLEQAQQGQASAMAASTALSEQLKAAEARSQELQVAESTLKAKLQAAFDNVTRLNHELQESKDAKAAQNLKLEDANRQHHETAKRLETAQADSRSLHEQVTDLRDRLSTAQAAITSLQGERDNLKNELASLDASAKVAATGEREAREQLAEIRQQLASRTQQYNELLGRYQPLSNQHAELNTSLQKREELVAELRDRLNAAEAVNAQLQADRDQLKDSLANEGKRSQSLATATTCLTPSPSGTNTGKWLRAMSAPAPSIPCSATSAKRPLLCQLMTSPPTSMTSLSTATRKWSTSRSSTKTRR